MVFAWLISGAVGPAAVGVPVNWVADALAGVAQRWFRRIRRTDDLSRLVRAAAGPSAGLSHAEFESVRLLLENPETWRVLGQGTVEDLAHMIVACLPPRDGRTATDSHVAALTIARGLLEFAVSDLDPKVFQQLLLARLQRMETNQANALDEALLDLHADLAARFTSVMDLFKRVLDGLPPGPANRCEIAWYLKRLIDWLNSDPWPQHRQFGGPVLTPAAIERKLRVTAVPRQRLRVAVPADPRTSVVRHHRPQRSDKRSRNRAREEDLDADELARQCRRLVILGGSGSGKTWLAMRTVRRCAETALEALAAGETLNEIELPLYTTCSRLLSAVGDVRQAVVSSALDQLGDLGGSRLSGALRAFFTERNAPTALVIDSLDEAHGSDERLRQADTLPWRIVLTSRPIAWNYQLIIDEESDSHRVAELQPLRYPGDVEPFIHQWFDQRPEWGSDLAAQIARRPGLQKAATVPLILAFYCIVGADQPLPALRRDLYTLVLRRMLTGRWRGSNYSGPDHDACLRMLRAWAWSGATSHPISGMGTWADDIPVELSQLSKADNDALDHVATPLGPPDIDTGKTLRRFIHRSVREHLVAEHVAGLPLDQATAVLLPHLWYDPDWEYSAPAAVAMHDQRDQLILRLIYSAASSEHVPEDFSVIDAGWEFRRFLARVAAESSETDWSPEVAGMIGQARVELARSGRTGDLGGAASWGTSNRQVRAALLGLLAGQTDAPAAKQLAAAVARLDPTEEDRRQAREALLRLLAGSANDWVIRQLADPVVELATTEDDRRQARELLLGLLADQTDGPVAAELAATVARLDPAGDDTRRAREALLRLLAGPTGEWMASQLTAAVAQLNPAEDERRQAREALLALLANVVARLDAAEDEALLGLTRQSDARRVAELAAAVARLATTEDERRRAGEALLGLLAVQNDSSMAAELAAAVARLDPVGDDRRRAGEALLGLLVGQTSTWVAAELAVAVAQLATTEDDRRKTREVLLVLLAGETDGFVASKLVDAVAGAGPTADERRQVREALLALLANHKGTWVERRLADSVIRLEPTVGDLNALRGRAFPPIAELFASVRRNSALADWLAALPTLTRDPIRPGEVSQEPASIGPVEP